MVDFQQQKSFEIDCVAQADGFRRIDGIDLVVDVVTVKNLIPIFAEWVVESHSRIEMGVSD